MPGERSQQRRGGPSKWSPEFREEAVQLQREGGESITAVAGNEGKLGTRVSADTLSRLGAVFTAVLDANVLYPFSLRDTFVRLAVAELYGPLWSACILEEMRRNVVEKAGVDEEYAARTVELLREMFEEAEVDASKIEALEPAMTNAEHDRHVLAAAVAADCELIVTFNLGDFPAEACAPLLVEAVHPDLFLLDLYDLNPDVVYRTIAEQAAALRRTTFEGLLEMLERAGVPRFVDAIRQHWQAQAGGR